MSTKPKREKKESDQVTILGTPEQCDRWRKRAHEEGRSISNWGGRALDAAIAKIPENEKAS